MKTLKQKLFELTQTRQELEAENERRRAEVEEKQYKLQDRKTVRSIAQIVLNPTIKGYTQLPGQVLTTQKAANIMDKGSSVIAPGTQVIDKSGYKNFRLY